METTATNVNIKQESIKNGLIMAAVSIVLFLFTNYVLPDMMGSTIMFIGQMIVGLLIAIALILDMRKKIGGYWTFGQALTHIFVMFMISAVVVYFFTIAFGKYIDTTYPERMKAIIYEKTEGMLKSMNMDQDDIDEAMRKQSADMEKQFDPSFSQMVVGLGIQLVMYFIGALIFAAIFKKSPPPHLQFDEE
ncbi:MULTISPECIES: DUF4199 domain-containing protein [Pedobacter]|uniref:DUF4199 domain-containing protein n=1 Tax=Pedobacter TaxID=84567 RepID=UPI002109413A|nr:MULTISPECIES: DUF4199 domain-containing protein [unclassified Pedobacter]